MRIKHRLNFIEISVALLIVACSTPEVGDGDTSEVMSLSSQIETLQDQLEILQSDYSTLQSESQRQAQTINQGNTKINQLENDINDLEAENQERSKGLDNTKSKVAQLEEVKETLLSQKGLLDQKLKELQSELTEATEKVANLQKENRELLSGNLKFQLETAEKKLKEAKVRIQQLKTLILELEQKLEENSEITEDDNNQVQSIKDGWYETTLVQFVRTDERNPDNNYTAPFSPTEGVYWEIENGVVVASGEFLSNVEGDTFNVSSKDVISISKSVYFNFICHRKNLQSPCERIDYVSMDNAPPIKLVEDGIQFSIQETTHYPEGVEVSESTYISRWLGDDIEDLPYQTNYNFTSNKGFNSDPIYSLIERDNPESYLKAFIKDAERHGLDLSFIDVQNFEFELVPGTNLGFAGIAWNNCNDKVSVGMNLGVWNAARTFDYGNPLIEVMWHEFGHTILGLAHTCKIHHIMWSFDASDGYEDPSECDSPPYEGQFGLIWDHPNPNNNWQRAVKDMFEGNQQVYFYCRNKRGEKKIYCGSDMHH